MTEFDRQMVGHRIIRLETVDSTNNYAAKMWKAGELEHGTVIMADEQTKGRGQRGKEWQSTPGESATFSFVLNMGGWDAKDAFFLQEIVSLALIDTLKNWLIDAAIKWPNDILVDGSKLAGVLVETSLSGTKIESAIVGIGLNINQTTFEVNTRTSIKMESGLNLDLTMVVLTFCKEFEKYWSRRQFIHRDTIRKEYLKHLFGFGEWRDFLDKDGTFLGKIQGLETDGRLMIGREGGTKSYDIQEIIWV